MDKVNSELRLKPMLKEKDEIRARFKDNAGITKPVLF